MSDKVRQDLNSIKFEEKLKHSSKNNNLMQQLMLISENSGKYCADLYINKGLN